MYYYDPRDRGFELGTEIKLERERERERERMGGVVKLLLLAFCCCLASAQYQPNWDSLDARTLPAWYDQSKFGIFIHWGVFSVPSYGGGATNKGQSEWFWWDWKGRRNPWAVEFMEENYLETFTYPDFAQQFRAEMFSPSDWARLIESSGAKWARLVCWSAEATPLSLSPSRSGTWC